MSAIATNDYRVVLAKATNDYRVVSATATNDYRVVLAIATNDWVQSTYSSVCNVAKLLRLRAADL